MNISWSGLELYSLADRFNLSVVKYIVWSIYLRQLIARIKPDILHAHRVSSAGWIAAFSGFHPLVVTPWGSDLYLHPLKSRLAKALAKYVLKRADLVTADSRDLCTQAIRFGANPKRTHLVQWGVDLKLYKPGSKSIDMLTKLKITTEPIILSPRAVKPIYNLDVIVETIPAIRKHYPGAIYLFRDYNTDPDYKFALEDRIAALQLNESVRWLERIEPWERNVEIYRLADLAISIASSDGTPGSVLEAFACGLPVIASDLPSLREWIINGTNGFLVPPRDPRELADAILNILEHPGLVDQFRRENLVLVCRRADQEDEMHKMENLYLELI